MSETLTIEMVDCTNINPYKFAEILDVIEEESDEMYVSARILESKSNRGRKAIEKQDYEEMSRILQELDEFLKKIGL